MKVYPQKQSKPQQPASHTIRRSSAKPVAASHSVHSILYLQRTIGNQAVQRLLQAHVEGLEAGSDTSKATRFAYDSSRMPVSSAASAKLQAKLTVNTPGDIYEQEADHISEQVMRMPEPKLQRACACGGGCPTCQTEQSGQEHARLQTKRVGSGDSEQTAAPPIVHEALASPGQPLDTATQALMEPRLGYDFSGVRVHTDTEAADGAHAIRARAYTIGRDIAFASGEYAPATMKGKRLLAHELAHVVQQGHARQLDDSLTQGFTKAESPAVISRQKTDPEETPGKQPEAENDRRRLKERLKKDIPCLGEPVDDTKARCQFSKAQSNMLRIVKQSAVRTCTSAIAAINMPGNENRVRQIAKDYFHLDIKLSEKTKRALIKTIKTISDNLEHATIECRTCQDEHCNRGLIGFVEPGRTVLTLCPPFFDSTKVHLAPISLLHEAGHLAGVNAPTRDELYCHQRATPEDKCPVVDAIRNADAWAYFIDNLGATI